MKGIKDEFGDVEDDTSRRLAKTDGRDQVLGLQLAL